jgi:hypothetical protein
VQAGPVPVGEPVLGAALVVAGGEAERGVVTQGGAQVPHREDRAEAPQLPVRPPAPGVRRRAGAPDLGQGRERGPHRLDLAGRQPVAQLLVDRVHPARHGPDGLLPPVGQRQGDPPAVRRIRAPLDVPPADQGVRHLADGLLGDAEIGGQVRPQCARVIDAGQDERAVSRQVIDPDGVQPGPDGPGVGAPRGAHQRGSGEGARPEVGHEPILASVNYLDSQASYQLRSAASPLWAVPRAIVGYHGRLGQDRNCGSAYASRR